MKTFLMAIGLLVGMVLLVLLGLAWQARGDTVHYGPDRNEGVVVASQTLISNSDIPATVIYTVPPANGGTYGLLLYTNIINAGSASSLLPGINIQMVDGDTGAVREYNLNPGNSENQMGFATFSVSDFVLSSGSNVAVYTASYASSPAGQMWFKVHVKLIWWGH